MSAAIPDPSPLALPLIQEEHLRYLGGFRMPNAPGFSFGGSVLAYDADTLLVSARDGRLARVSIVAPVVATLAKQLPRAVLLQPFTDPLDGTLAEVGTPGDTSLAGALLTANGMINTAVIYYDANNRQRIGHRVRPGDLRVPGRQPWDAVLSPTRQGLVAGYLASVPIAWQARLGGDVVTGQWGIPIVSRTSYGPALFAIQSADLRGAGTVVPARPLVFYPSDHATLGPWEGSNAIYGGTAQCGGVVLPRGARTALFFGRNGIGEFCYGSGTSDRTKHNTTLPSGEHLCYDPTNDAKGQHAWPYHFQVWAYDLAQLAAVGAGTRAAWDVTPYRAWSLDLPTPHPMVQIGGVAYDEARQRIFLVQMKADNDGVASQPIVHVFDVTMAPVVVPPPVEPPPVVVPPPVVLPPPVAVRPATQATMLDYFAAAEIANNSTKTPAQIFERAAAMLAESERRRG